MHAPHEFPESWEPARREAHWYAMDCLAHRLRKWGFEPIVNRLDAQSMRLLSTMVHEPLASALLREAESKEAA